MRDRAKAKEIILKWIRIISIYKQLRLTMNMSNQTKRKRTHFNFKNNPTHNPPCLNLPISNIFLLTKKFPIKIILFVKQFNFKLDREIKFKYTSKSKISRKITSFLNKIYYEPSKKIKNKNLNLHKK